MQLSHAWLVVRAAIEEHAEQSAKAQSRLDAALQEQERLRRETTHIKQEKTAKDLYVTDVEGKLSSRESSLSESQRELNVLKQLVRDLQEESEKMRVQCQGLETELNQARAARGVMQSRMDALEVSHTEEEAR